MDLLILLDINILIKKIVIPGGRIWQNVREKNIGWRIDYFIVSDRIKENIEDAKIHPEIFGSDHCPVIELKINI